MKSQHMLQLEKSTREKERSIDENHYIKTGSSGKAQLKDIEKLPEEELRPIGVLTSLQYNPCS